MEASARQAGLPMFAAARLRYAAAPFCAMNSGKTRRSGRANARRPRSAPDRSWGGGRSDTGRRRAANRPWRSRGSNAGRRRSVGRGGRGRRGHVRYWDLTGGMHSGWRSGVDRPGPARPTDPSQAGRGRRRPLLETWRRVDASCAVTIRVADPRFNDRAAPAAWIKAGPILAILLPAHARLHHLHWSINVLMKKDSRRLRRRHPLRRRRP